MTLGILFWVIYIIVFLFGGWATYEPANFRPVGIHLALMLLVGILGWGVYGSIVK